MTDPGRRALLGQALAVGATVALGGAGTTGRGGAAGASEAWPPAPGLPPEITPAGRFYTVSKNVFDPSVVAATWTLRVGGLVEAPYTLTLEELRRLPAVEVAHTLMCISNEVGGDLISNATWKGVPLSVLLDRARPHTSASELILRAQDGYSDSFPVAAARRAGTILAYEMNGAPLAKQHGFPTRVLVAGIYGMKNVKWLTELEVADQDYHGYWARRGWSDTAIYKTFARIDLPSRRATLRRGQPAWTGGVAFAGDRGVRAVEVSVDGGVSWRPARTKRAMGAHTWVLWAFPWTPVEVGRTTLVARAVDGTGAVQPEGPRTPLPDGAEGWHRVPVGVE